MYKNIFLSLVFAFICTGIYSQQLVSGSYLEPTQISVNQDCSFNHFHYNYLECTDLPIPHIDRDYPGASSYLSFTVPVSGEASVKLEFSEEKMFGLAFYLEDELGNYDEIRSQVFINTQGELRVYTIDDAVGETVIARVWVIDGEDTGDFYACVISEDPESYPKINVHVGMYTPAELVHDVLLSGCVEAYNVQYTGHPEAIAYFNNGIPPLDFAEGVIMSTGYAVDAQGPNTGNASSNLNYPGDSDLSNLINGNTNDAAVLEFDFMPATNEVTFEYVFASDEYHTYANSSYNDVFAFFINGGPETYNNENIALIPGLGIPVSINNVNNGTSNNGPCMNCQFFIANSSGNPHITYDGMTVTFTAHAQVTQCSIYHMKLAIADVSDGILDSAVFLKAGSFMSGDIYEVSSFNAWGADVEIMQGCSNFIVFERTDETPLSEAVPVELTIEGTAIMGQDYSEIPTSFEIPAFQESDTVFFDSFVTGNTEVTTVVLNFENGCPCTTSNTQHTIEIHPPFEINATAFNSGPICIGESADLQLTLNAQEQEQVSVEWSTGDIGHYNVEVNPTQTTTYTVTITYPCDEIELSTQVIVVEPPVVDLGPDLEIDQLSTTLNANMNPDNTGYWTYIEGSGPGEVIIDDVNSSITNVEVDAFGYYSFIWTETSLEPNCVTSDTITIYFYHIPTADFEATFIPCFGDLTTITFVGSAIDGLAEFYWDFGDGIVMSGSGEGPYQVLFPSSGNHTVCLTVLETPAEAHYCLDIYMPTLLEGEMIIQDDPCYQSCGGIARIEVTGGTPPYDYSWASSTNQIINLCTGDYGVVVTDANGCQISEAFFIDQPEELVYDTSYYHVDCYGNPSGCAEITASGGTSPYTYSWSDGFIGGNHCNIYAGVYTVTVSDSNGCTAFEQFTITQPNQLLVATSSDLSICEHQTINVVGQEIGGTPPYTYYWDNGDGTGFSEGPQSFQETPNESVTYSVYIVDGNDCVSPTEHIEIIVSPEIFLTLNYNHNSCFNSCDGSASLSIVGGIQPFNYSWESSGPNMNNLCAGLYTVTITDDIGCMADTLFIISEPNQLMMQIDVNNTSCHNTQDGTASVIVQGGTPPYNYIWSDNNQTSTLENGPGTYTLTVSDDNNCRIYGSATIQSPQPLQVLPLYHPNICLGGEATVIAQANGGTHPYSFHWQGSDGSEYNSHMFNVSPEQNTSYSLTVTDANGCVNLGQLVNVTVKPPITIDHLHYNTNHVCQGQGTTIELDISGGNGGPYQINLNDGSIVTSPFTYYPNDTTNLIITVNDLCETPSAKDSLMIYVQPKPTISFTVDKNQACPGELIKFTQHDTINSYSYVWDFGDNKFAYIQNPIHAYSEEGIYDVTLSIRDQYDCKNTYTMNSLIEIWPKPYANFMADPEVATIINPRIRFINLSEGELFVYWYYGDGDSTINFRNPEHYYSHMGEYEVTLIAINEEGCRDTATRTVLIKDKFSLYAPTAFTPNGDGINDCFRVCGSGIDANSFYMVIYNRWGEKVFENEKFDKDADCNECGKDSWDGTRGDRMKGDEYLPTGLYFWYVTFKDYDGIGHEFSGQVNLIR